MLLIVEADTIFQCYNGDRHLLSAKCDGIVDCVGGSFEDEPDLCGKQDNAACIWLNWIVWMQKPIHINFRVHHQIKQNKTFSMIPHLLHTKGYFSSYDEKYHLLSSLFFCSFNRKHLKLIKNGYIGFAFKLFILYIKFKPPVIQHNLG